MYIDYTACNNDDTSLNIYIFVIALTIRSLGDYQELGMLFGWAFLVSSNEINTYLILFSCPWLIYSRSVRIQVLLHFILVLKS